MGMQYGSQDCCVEATVGEKGGYACSPENKGEEVEKEIMSPATKRREKSNFSKRKR